MSNGRSHPPYLAIAAFRQRDFDPRSRNVLAIANRRLTRRQRRFFIQYAYKRRPRAISLNGDTRSKLA